MKNNGKKLEDSIFKIQKTLIPSNSKIELNKKLTNTAGNKREFDIVIIEPNRNIITAIECKDFKNPVPVKEIEALYGKKLRTKGLNKTTFVSGSGYQKDSIPCAKDFGIDLYKYSDNKLENQPAFNNMKGNFMPKSIKFIANNDEITINYSDEFFKNGSQENYNLIYSLGHGAFDMVNYNKMYYFIMMTIQSDLKKGNKNDKLFLPFCGKLDEPIKFKCSEGYFTDFIISVEFNIESNLAEISENKLFSLLKDNLESPIASKTDLNLKNGKSVDCVFSHENSKLFLNHADGSSEELVVLATFDKDGNLKNP